MNDNSRKTDTESTQYITHTDVGASTITECRQPDIPQRKSNSGITLDTHPLSRQTTHHLLKDIEGIKEHNRESGEFSKQEPYDYDGLNRYRRRHPRPTTTALIALSPIRLWRRFKDYLRLFLSHLI